MKKPRAGTIILILWAMLLSGAVTVYLTYLQPARLGKTVSDALESSLGTPASIRQVDFFLFPNPAIHIYGLKVEQGDEAALEFRADSCSAQLSWLSLLRFKPVVKTVDLQGPVFDVTLPESKPDAKPEEEAKVQEVAEKATKPIEMAMPASLPDLPYTITGIRIKISNGIFRLRQVSSQTQILLNGISGSARLPGMFSGNIDLSVRNSTLRFNQAPTITLSDFSMRATSLNEDHNGEITGSLALSSKMQLESLERALGHPVAEAYQYFPLPEPASLGAVLDIAASAETGLITVSGKMGTSLTLPMNGHPTPIEIVMPFSMQSFDEVTIDNMVLSAGKDSGVISGTLTGLPEKKPTLTGRADIHHFSLIHWFGFGRKMTAGLQIVLDDISGNMDFVLTHRGVKASRLEARVLDMVMTGTGGCEDFLNPVVDIAGHIKYANLNPVFPEINGIETTKPNFPPPAVPIDDDDNTPARVGFRIDLSADAVDIYKLQAGNVSCLISPILDPYGPPPVTDLQKELASAGKSGAKLDIVIGNVYEGKAEAEVLLEEPYRITGKASGVEMEELIARLAGFKALGGTLNATATTSFSGSSPAEMIANLKASLQGTLQNGFFGAKSGKTLPYRKITLNAKGAAIRPTGPLGYHMPDTMDIRGAWDVVLDMTDFNLAAKTDAVMTFDMHTGLPKSMLPQPVNTQLTLYKAGLGNQSWPDDMQFSLKGQSAFDLDAGTIEFANITGSRSGLILSGSLHASDIYNELSIAGPISVKTAILKEITPQFGLELPQPLEQDRLSFFSFESFLHYTPLKLTFDKIVATLDDTAITGNLAATLGTRKFWTGALQTGAINGDLYWPDSSPTVRTPIPEDLLSTFDMDIRLHIAEFTLFDSSVQSLILPVQLSKGKLSTGVFSGSFPSGGTLAGSYQGEITPPVRDHAGKVLTLGNLNNRLQLRINDLNMLPLTRRRKQDTLIAGHAFCQSDVQARLQYWSDIPKNLDGNWSLQIRDGYWVDRQAEELYTHTVAASSQTQPTFGLEGKNTSTSSTPHSPRTPFQHLTVSGNILGGVLHSKDFLLKGSMLTVTGSGSIDLNTKTIDAAAVATLLGVPEMPITISGSLDSPKTSYKIMGAVTGTMGNIAGGFADVVTGIITAPFRFLRK